MTESERQDASEASAGKEPEIVVDTDWKEQVAKEKQTGQIESAETIPAESARGEKTPDLPPPPPASFEMLISMLFTQAMAALGQIPDPVSGKASVNKPYAKHYIDTLDMLCEKTKGNLSESESRMADEALHAMRMTYVNTKQA